MRSFGPLRLLQEGIPLQLILVSVKHSNMYSVRLLEGQLCLYSELTMKMYITPSKNLQI